MTFYVGQKVVYVGAIESRLHRLRQWLFPPPGGLPVKGNVYVVSEVFIHEPDLMIEVAEIKTETSSLWVRGFRAVSFRPVVERKTDISIFTKMLDRTPSHETA